MSEPSPAGLLAAHLVSRIGEDGAHRFVDVLLSKFTTTELAALAIDWPFWARPKQLPPAGNWRTWGFLTGRMFGKTRSVSEFINGEVEAGNVTLIGLAAQDEASAIDIQVLGPSGLVATSSPRQQPEWLATSMQLVWPNGARAYVRTPEVPGKIRGLEYHLSWLSEIQSWPAATREEAYSNFLLSTRLGYARIVWDATPKRRHPLLRELLDAANRDPAMHVVVRGLSAENRANVGDGVIEDLERKYGGTQKGREELFGEMLDESENALFQQVWIDRARRPMPTRLARRVVSIDPAVTSRAGSDRTGIIDAGVDADGQMMVLGDRSNKYKPDEWASITLDLYVSGGCDLVVVETNKGGDLVTSNLRAAAAKRGLQVVVLGKDERPRRNPGVIYVREVHARGPKEDRAQPLATAYEKGRVSHVDGVDLRALEELLTTWEPSPGQRSPDALDALVHAAIELLGLLENRVDAKVAFKGITEFAQGLQAPPRTNVAAVFSGHGTGGRI